MNQERVTSHASPPARRVAPVWWWLGAAGGVALAALAAAALGVNAVAGPSPHSNVAARRYLPASDFSFTLYQGEAQLGRTEGTLAQLRGRPVILHFWSSGCRPCLEELPRLQDLHEQAGGKAIMMGVDVGLLLDRGTGEEAQAALLQHHVTYPVGFPKDSSLVEQYNLRRIPTTVFINRRGEVFRRWAGPMSQEDLLGIAGALLADDGRQR